MTEDRRKILEMLANKKVSVDEAFRLLSVIDTPEGEKTGLPPSGITEKARPKYLRVTVLPNPESSQAQNFDRVNVRVPVSLIRAGIRLTSLIPPESREKVSGALREKGIDFDMRNFKPEDLDEIVDALGELEVDVIGSKGESIKVFTE